MKNKEVVLGTLFKFPNFISPTYEINGVEVSWDVVGEEFRREKLDGKDVVIIARITDKLKRSL